MKLLKPWGSAGGGLLHLALLLSSAGLREDRDLSLLLLLPPRPRLRHEPPVLGCPTRSACALSPFPAPGGWGRASPLHPKDREPDTVTPLEGLLLREVRALGVPFIPHTRVDAWLVHSVATGDADGTHELLGAAASSAVGDGSGQAAAGGGGDPRTAHSSPVAAVEEQKAAEEPTAQVRDADGRASQENEILRESEAVYHSIQHEEESALENPQQQNDGGESKRSDTPDWKAEKAVGSRIESISLEGIPPCPGSMNQSLNSSAHYNTIFNQVISHDVNLHEAMLLCPNNTLTDSVARTSHAQEPFLQLNSHINLEQALTAINLTGSLQLVDNRTRNLTNLDLLYDLDGNMFDEITLMSLATEVGFDPVEVSQLFEEPDCDSGPSSSHKSTSMIKSNSSHSTYNGALGSNSYLPSLCHYELEGAVGGYSPEPSKFCHMDHRNKCGFHEDLACQHIFHNHTYHLHPGEQEPTSEPRKSHTISRYLDDTERTLSRDEQRAKALHIPFSVDEIVHMPVDSLNNMLSRYNLTDLQVSLIRDIRRRGKNKVAAQNCRKRKLDIIVNLDDDVCNLQAKKEALEREQAQYYKAIDIMKQKLHDLYCDVLSRLRDDQGRPVNPSQYELQCSHDGTVLIVPKELVTSNHKKEARKGKREDL
uniref:nuclear factor erythroid 2-related factor 3 n=1 Tax=Jaculus jaculus TaxID=51337 RepID=UPI001E1B3823|nr:nuclear factor erythroid 2-related factor 3 [Jaculus jaculus]